MAVLLAVFLSSFAVAQESSPVSGESIISFTLHRGDTVWGIWNHHAREGVTWAKFYEKVAALNPTYAQDRFTSVPEGSEIQTPSSLVDITSNASETNFQVTEEITAPEPQFTFSQSTTPVSSESLDAVKNTLSRLNDSVEALTLQVKNINASVLSVNEPAQTSSVRQGAYILAALALLVILILGAFTYFSSRFLNEKISESRERELSLQNENTYLNARLNSYSDTEKTAAVRYENLLRELEAHRGNRARLKLVQAANKRLREEVLKCYEEINLLRNKQADSKNENSPETHKPTRHGSTHGGGRARQVRSKTDSIDKSEGPEQK